jgi:hypothetical protein
VQGKCAPAGCGPTDVAFDDLFQKIFVCGGSWTAADYRDLAEAAGVANFDDGHIGMVHCGVTPDPATCEIDFFVWDANASQLKTRHATGFARSMTHQETGDHTVEGTLVLHFADDGSGNKSVDVSYAYKFDTQSGDLTFRGDSLNSTQDSCWAPSK